RLSFPTRRSSDLKIARLAHGRMLLLLLVSLLGSLILPLASRWLGRGAGLLMSVLPFGLLAAFVVTAPIVERGWVQGEGIQWAPTLRSEERRVGKEWRSRWSQY